MVSLQLPNRSIMSLTLLCIFVENGFPSNQNVNSRDLSPLFLFVSLSPLFSLSVIILVHPSISKTIFPRMISFAPFQKLFFVCAGLIRPLSRAHFPPLCSFKNRKFTILSLLSVCPYFFQSFVSIFLLLSKKRQHGARFPLPSLCFPPPASTIGCHAPSSSIRPRITVSTWQSSNQEWLSPIFCVSRLASFVRLIGGEGAFVQAFSFTEASPARS